MWTCSNCGAWNEPERTNCAECGVSLHAMLEALRNPRHEMNIAEIAAILYGPKVDVPEGANWTSGPKLYTPFDDFPDEWQDF